MTSRMSRSLSFAVAVLAFVLSGVAAAAQSAGASAAARPEDDKTAIRQAVYDYAEGFYEGAAERVERAVHPALVKRAVLPLFRNSANVSLQLMNAETLIETTRQGGGKAVPRDQRNLSYALLDTRQDVASARIFSAGFNDYVHLVKQGGRWRIANVLWTRPKPGPAAEDGEREAVTQAMQQYYDCMTAYDSAGMERWVHPEAALRSFGQDLGGEPYIREGTRSQAVEQTRAKAGRPPQDAAITVLDVYDDIASVMVTSSANVTYWHLTRQNGEWRLLNRLTRIAPPRAQAGRMPLETERMVDVGGYKLNLSVLTGKGKVILLESGGNMDSTEWAMLAPVLARRTGATVVAYDRAGLGKSDLPESRYDLREETAALWRALGQLGLDHDLVLVGHSYGGFLLRFYAAAHPETVKGLVFVDPFTVELVDALGLDFYNNHPALGKLPFDASQPEKLTKAQRALARMSGAPGSNLGEKCDLVRKASVAPGIPVRILTSGLTDWMPQSDLRPLWRQSHERLAAAIPGATLVVAERSDHMIPFCEPDFLIGQIAEVVRLAK